MQVERIDHFHAWAMVDVEKVALFFRDMFDMTVEVNDFKAWGVKTCIVRTGDDRRFIEFKQSANPDKDPLGPPRPGMYGINLKVPDIEKAVAEMKERGFEPIYNFVMGDVKQVWFDTEEILGLKIEFSEYPGDNLFEAANLPPEAKQSLPNKSDLKVAKK